MKCEYNAQDLIQRVVGGIIFFEEEPFFVIDVYKKEFLCNPVGVRVDDLVRIPINSSDIDLSRRTLGYVNIEKDGTALYCTQDTVRRYKQTLSRESLSVFDPRRNAYIYNSPRQERVLQSFNADGFINSRAFRQMLMNEYDRDGQKAVELLRSGKKTTIAVSREVAFYINTLGVIEVFYKTDKVGFMTDNDTQIKIPKGEFSQIVKLHLQGLNIEVD